MTKEERDRINRAEEIQRYTENRCESLEMENAELKDYNKKLLQSDIDKQNKIVLLSKKVNDLQKENAELQKWKDEWQEQVQKATDEGYARTLQTMQLTKATKIIKELCGMVRELNKPNVQLTNVDYSLAEAEQFIKDSEVKK